MCSLFPDFRKKKTKSNDAKKGRFVKETKGHTRVGTLDLHCTVVLRITISSSTVSFDFFRFPDTEWIDRLDRLLSEKQSRAHNWGQFCMNSLSPLLVKSELVPFSNTSRHGIDSWSHVVWLHLYHAQIAVPFWDVIKGYSTFETEAGLKRWVAVV